MKIEIAIIIVAITTMTIYSLNKFFSNVKILILALILSFIVFLMGFILKKYDILIYKLLIMPFIQIGFLALFHLIFRLAFKIPFNLNMRGFEYPDKLKTNESGLEEFLSGCFSIGLIPILIIIFLVIK